MSGRSLLSILLLAIAGSLPMAAQQGDPSDTTGYEEWEDPWADTWNLDSLDPSAYDIRSDLISHYSSGWFATPNAGGSFLVSLPLVDYIFDRAGGIRSAALVPTVEPFADGDPYRCHWLTGLWGECSEREILKRNSDEPIDEDPPERGFTEYAVRLEYHLPIPLMLRAEGHLRLASGMLYAEDTTRSFLSLSGIEHPFREIAVLNYERTLLGGSVGLKLPFYGVFLESEALTIGSYYYLYGGVSGSYAVWNKATQFFQIADAKEHLRYDNGMDTATVIRDVSPPGFNRFRTGVEGAIGWQFAAEGVALGIEAFASAPTESLLQDAEWRDWFGGIMLAIGYHWGPTDSD